MPRPTSPTATVIRLALFIASPRWVAAMSLAPGSKVLVVGNGPVQCLAARIAAIRGYDTTLAVIGNTQATDEAVLFDSTYTKETLPLTIMPVTGDDADEATIESCINEAVGLIIAFDNERTLPERSMNVFMPEEGGSLAHVSLMSRSLNGKGMGFTASAAKAAANVEIWAGGSAIEQYRDMEARLRARAASVGADATIIRAGTLKGGASGSDSAEDEGGEPTFLNPFFYTLGQQDIVNWRLLYDCKALGVEMTAGDTMAGPGFTAALTATDRIGSGDSHRGAVATALVEALGVDAAKGKDFSIAAKESREFPQADAWPAMFVSAK